MRLTCTQENFKMAILAVEKVTSKQVTLPILKNILLETKDGRLIFSATNLEIGIVCKIGAKIEENGVIVIPARLISDFVLNLPHEENIELELDGQILKIKCGKYKAKINCLDSDDFPIIPKEEKEYQFSLDGSVLKNIINKNLSSISLNDIRVEFTGINVIFGENELYFASTDGFRLVEYKFNIKKEAGFSEIREKSIIIPAETLRELNKILSIDENKNDNTIYLLIENNQIFFKINDIKIVSRLINGKYPDYKQIIPNEFKTNIIINKDELLRATKIASVFTKNKDGEINLKIFNDKVLIKSESLEVGENEVELNILEKKGEDQEVTINPRYLIDALNTMETNKISIFINNGESPIGIRMVNDDNNVFNDYIYIIMPIKK